MLPGNTPSYHTRERLMKNRKTTIILLLSFFVGLSVLLYPTISSYWNSKTQSQAIVDYESMLSQYKPEDYTAIFEQAENYNKKLAELAANSSLKDAKVSDKYNTDYSKRWQINW